MQNNRNYRGFGYPQYDSFPSSSRGFEAQNGRNERWTDETEWSSRDETWRGSSHPNRPPPPQREDSWKMDQDFRLGRDRAPMPVDDQFLVRYGAKRLNNGNLVDRDGYTLRVRDPECRAPSPPPYNPGRDARRSTEHADATTKRSKLDNFSQDDLDKRARQQMEMMKNEEERRMKQKKEKEAEKEEELDGEDEYEEVVDEDIRSNGVKEEHPSPPKPFTNNIKKPLLSSPLSSSSSPTKLPVVGSTYPPPTPNIKKPLMPVTPSIHPMPPKPTSWCQQYRQHVDTFKDPVYFFGNPTTSAPKSSGYFFQSTPTSSSIPPGASPSMRTASGASGASPALRTPSSSTSSPYYGRPRPGSAGFEGGYPSISPAQSSSSATSSSLHLYPNHPIASYPITHASVSDPFGVRSTGTSLNPQSQPQRPPPPRQESTSSSSDSEDEAIVKLREIIKNYGRKT